MSALPASPARFDASRQRRHSMIGKVKVAVKQLRMADDDYHQIVFDQTGRLSLGDCNETQIAKVLDVMKAKGFRPIPKAGNAPAAMHPMARRARAMWVSLYHLGAVHNRSEQALEAFAKRQLKCERLVWARQSDSFRLIEALKAMAVRNGWRLQCLVTQKPLAPLGLQASLCAAILDKLVAAKVAPANWSLDEAAWKLCGIDTGNTEHGYTAEDYQNLATALGGVLRQHGGLPNG